MVKKTMARGFVGILLAFLYLPILWMIAFSFTESNTLSDWRGFSLDAYVNLFSFSSRRSPQIFEALGNTMIIAVSAATIATVLGALAAIGLQSMRRKRIKAIYNNLSQIPMINADIVTAISLMLLFASLKTFLRIEGDSSMVNVVLAHVAFCVPYVILNVVPRLKSMDDDLYEAALDLGAKPRQAILRVIIPQCMSGIVMGFIMALTLSIDDFVVSQFNIDGGFNTLSTYIYSVNSGKQPLPTEIRALSSLMFLLILGLLLFINVKNAKSANNTANRRKTR
jgi:spermidine/putrescine transport system permease protein